MKSNSSSPVKRTFLKDYRPPSFSIRSTDLKFDLDPGKTTVSSKIAVIRTNCAEANDFYLNGNNLELLSIQMNQEELPESGYGMDSQGITLINPPNEFELSISNRIDPSKNLALSGLYMSGDMLCTQCEAEGFRNITYFPDRPDILSKFSVTIEASQNEFPILLSNGELVATDKLPDGRHFATWIDPHPKPCYLFALVAGKLSVLRDTFVTRSNNRVTLEFYTSSSDLDQCVHAMKCLKRAMKWDEEVYGREYDMNRYMIVAVDHFNMGAMENKGLNIFNSKYVFAKPDTATDQDFHAVESVIAHEYFHNWSGNRVTLRDWFQLSLKEGFTIYRDQQFSSDIGSPAVQRIHDVNMVKLHQFREDAGPSRHPVQPDSYLTIDNFYTITVYNKGAELIRMMHLLIGTDSYRAGTDLYFERYDGLAATVEDFATAMEEASGVNLEQFRLWYRVGGTPIVSIQRKYDPARGTFMLTMEQKPPHASEDSDWSPLHIPIQIALLDNDGKRLPLKLDSNHSATQDEMLLELTQSRQTFNFFDLESSPTLSLLRGFSAPVLIDDPQADQDLHFIMAHDDDAYCRWNACQQVFKLQVQQLVANIQNSQETDIESEFLSSFNAVLSNAVEDPQFKALLLEPPSEISIAQTMEIVDPTAIHNARKILVKNLADRYYDQLIELYRTLNGDWGDSTDAVGKRSLRNLCLNYLIELDDSTVQKLALHQFESSSNMTDLAAALRALVNSSSPARELVLQMFYDRWRDDSGVIDKWFRIQATAARPDTFKNVVDLSKHQSFNIYTPNRVYSLIGAFCHANPYCFHARDGSGYDLLTEYVLRIDKSNSQAAAQLTEAFTEIRRFDQDRQDAMRQRIEQIAATPGISVNVYEIVDRILAPFRN